MGSPSAPTNSPSLVQNAATALASWALKALAKASAVLRTAAISGDSGLSLSPGTVLSWAASRYSEPARAAAATSVRAAVRNRVCLVMGLLLVGKITSTDRDFLDLACASER